MSRMTENQRAQFDRPELGHSGHSPLLSARSTRWPALYTAIAIAIAAVLCVAAVTLLDSWPQWVVLGAVVTVALGLVIAISPTRRG